MKNELFAILLSLAPVYASNANNADPPKQGQVEDTLTYKSPAGMYRLPFDPRRYGYNQTTLEKKVVDDPTIEGKDLFLSELGYAAVVWQKQSGPLDLEFTASRNAYLQARKSEDPRIQLESASDKKSITINGQPAISETFTLVYNYGTRAIAMQADIAVVQSCGQAYTFVVAYGIEERPGDSTRNADLKEQAERGKALYRALVDGFQCTPNDSAK